MKRFHSCLRYCKSTIFQANHNQAARICVLSLLFAILQKYDFPSKSQPNMFGGDSKMCCLRYCKSTIFQANHNYVDPLVTYLRVVCDTAKVRFSKQITTKHKYINFLHVLFAILQKYDFPSKSQRNTPLYRSIICCLRYCKSTIFQANHNQNLKINPKWLVVCDTAKVRFSKQITTLRSTGILSNSLFAILQKYDFPSKSQPLLITSCVDLSCLRYCKSTIFQANHNWFFGHGG